MFCTLFIETDREVGLYMDYLIATYNVPNLNAVFANTTLAASGVQIDLYRFGYVTHATNYLFAEESLKTLRIFIESSMRRDSIQQLISGIQSILESQKQFYKSHGIKVKSISLTIWSEGDEVVYGETSSFSKDLKENLINVPAGIYVTVFSGVYTFFQEDKSFAKFGYNMLVVVGAILIWLTIRLLSTKRTIKYKVKS